jgi:Big-like domain-containing protein
VYAEPTIGDATHFPAIRRAAVLTVLLLSACGGGSDLLLPGTGEPAAITLVQGNGQNGRVGDTLPQPLVAAVTDGAGRPVEGATVVFVLTDPAPGASLSPDTTTTDAGGTATAQVVLGTRPGTQAGEVRALGSQGQATASAPFSLNAVSENANGITAVSGMDQSGQVGTVLANPLVVQVADAFGNPIPGVDVAWTADGGGSVSSATSTTGADGQTSVTRTLGTAAGTERTLASVDGLAGSPVTFVHTATAGAASGVSIVSGDDQTGPISTELPIPLVVAVKDGDGNPVPAVAVSWVIGSGGGSVTPTTSSTDAAGQATAAWTMGGTPGPNTVSAVVSGIGVAEFSATATAGAPARLSVLIQPSATAVSGAVLGQQPVIQLLDAGGNPATQSGVAVQVAIASGSGLLAGATSMLSDGNGRATFTNLAITGVPGTYTLRFSAAGFAAVTSTGINLAAAPTVTTITADTPDPSRTGDQVTVRFSVTSANGTPSGSVQIADGSNTCTGTLSGGEGSCAIGFTTAGSRTLTATYAGANGFGASSDTEEHTVEAPPPPVLTLATQPGSPATAGVALNPQPVVQLKTGDGANLSTAGVAVSVTIQGGGSLSGTTQVATDGNGLASFTDLVISGDPGTRTLLFTASGFTSVTSSSITVVAAPPSAAQSSIVPSPSTITAGSASTITVTVRDAGGNLLGGRTVTPQASGSGNTLTPGSAVTGTDGTAAFTFSSTTPEAKTISASVDGVDLSPTQVTVEPVPTATAILGTDPAGTSEAGTPVIVSYAVTAGAETPTGDVTVTSNLGGTCTDTVPAGHCTLEGLTPGTHTLTATYLASGSFAGSGATAAYEVTAGGP